MTGVRITGVRQEIIKLNEQWTHKRAAFLNTGRNIAEDWLRKSKSNAPIAEGTLRDTGTCNVQDRGLGKGFIIAVGFDTPYAMRMHEAHYQAWPRQYKKRMRSKKTGRVYYKYLTGKSKDVMRTIRHKRGGIKVTQQIALFRGEFWIDSKGRKIGRKYITRALNENLSRYKAALQITALQP